MLLISGRVDIPPMGSHHGNVKDVDGDGQLRFGEFLCAMHLAERHNWIHGPWKSPKGWLRNRSLCSLRYRYVDG